MGDLTLAAFLPFLPLAPSPSKQQQRCIALWNDLRGEFVVHGGQASVVRVCQRQQVAIRDACVAGEEFGGEERWVGDAHVVRPEDMTGEASDGGQRLHDLARRAR